MKIIFCIIRIIIMVCCIISYRRKSSLYYGDHSDIKFTLILWRCYNTYVFLEL